MAAGCTDDLPGNRPGGALYTAKLVPFLTAIDNLRTWMATGIACPRATSIIENLIRELVGRLKKIGWNWSDAGAARMGRIVMVRRYDQERWDEYWKRRMNLQGQCTARLTRCDYILSA